MQLDFFRAGEPVAPDLGLRPYQQEARESVHHQLATHRGTVAVMATGLGKTRLIGAVAWDYRLRRERVLVLCPTIELCGQMARSLSTLGLAVGVEQASNRVDRPLPDVTVASVDSMRGARLESFGRHDFGLVVFDEAHKSVSKRSLAIFEHFDRAKRLGVTATPDRSDRKSLASVYESVAIDMPLLAGIEQGWLCQLRLQSVQTDWDPSRLREIVGDVDPEDVVAEITRSGCMSAAVHAMCDLAGDDRAVAFLPTVASSKAFCREVNARHVRSPNVAQWAAHVDGTTPQKIRDEVFAAFRDGTTRVISNVGILVEGWDAPHATVCAILAPTKSRARLAQMIGRVTRNHPGKARATVLDFCPGRLHSGRLASPLDVLAGEAVSDELLAQVGKVVDTSEFALVVQENERAKARAREDLAERKARTAARKAARESRRIEPVSVVYGLEEHNVADIFTGRGDIAIKCASQGVDMQSVNAERKAAGLCSLKQARLFAREGLNPNMRASHASAAMAIISKNNWHAQDWMRSHPHYSVR